MCTSRFDFKDEQRAIINKYLFCEEIQAAREERDTQASGFDPISDNEEGGEGDSTQIRCTDQAPGERSQDNGGVLDLRQRRVMEMIMEMTMKIQEPFHFLTYSSVRQVGFGNDQGFLMDMKHCLLCLTTRG